MPTRPAAARTDPLEGIDRLLVDGTNLLHAIRRGQPAAPPATLIGRLRGVIEMPVRIELLFDGPPDQGLRNARIASGVMVRYSGRLSADAVLARLVVEAQDPGTVLVVTDDVGLRHEITRRGGRTASARWLVGRLDRGRLLSPAVGRPGPAMAIGSPAQQAAAADLTGDSDAAAQPGWRPGRGATVKKGNPHRPTKAVRSGPNPATGRPTARSPRPGSHR